ncbi:hypothetical protein PLICRDRAFT_88052 [Plicaturopsis crispa FD-325 SS-3]|nr:hypothetical protein PLICRDRAFT_88052 [Plicaturopsis crispa FD-325 SS-3]
MAGFATSSIFEPQPIVCQLISTWMFGMSTIQTFVYFNHPSRDPLALKLSVAMIWLLEIAYTVCFAHGTYTITVTYYGNTAVLRSVPKTIMLSFLFNGLVGPIVQSVNAKRLREFTGNCNLALAIWMLSLLVTVLIVGLTVKALQAPTVGQLDADCSWLFISAIAVAAANDWAIAIILCYHFWKQKTSVLRRRTVRLLDLLILWTLHNGLLTSIAILVQLVTFLYLRQTWTWMALCATDAMWYSNSLLASLNGRERLRAYSTGTIINLAEMTWIAPPNAALNVGTARVTERQPLPISPTNKAPDELPPAPSHE